jgi:predicted AAA+ superfamily ATPase
MTHPTSGSPSFLLHQAALLLVYQSVLEVEAGSAFWELLQALDGAQQHGKDSHLDGMKAYGRWFRALVEHRQSWQDYLLERILRDDNPFTRLAQQMAFDQLPANLKNAACHDLRILQQLCEGGNTRIGEWLESITGHSVPSLTGTEESQNPPILQLRSALQAEGDWAEGLPFLVALYQKHGVGVFAEYRAFRWQAGNLKGIAHPDPVQVVDLVGYEAQKEVLLKNTESLLQGYSALHVLLYGSRGSGKSSLVKGLLHQYGDRGLRLVEVAKSELADLLVIVEQLRQQPQKFIIFVDDLSFEEDEDNYKALKVVLEGNLTARPQNVVVYATSNRRHLIREFFGDRPRPSEGDEVHAWDTVQEKLSFSDRFGLTLTFEPADQKTYLQIVHHLAAQANLSLSSDELEFRALQWATRRNGRSGRTARQFIDFLVAEQGMIGQHGELEGNETV